MRAALQRLGIALACAASAALAPLPPGLAAAAEHTQPEWPLATPAALGVDGAALARLAPAIAAGKYPKTTSVLIVYRHRLIYEGYFGVGGRTYLNNTRSATKSITALAVGAAIDDHAISAVTAAVLPYLSELEPFKNDSPLKRSITIADLLTMSSPLDCDDDAEASPGNEDRMHEERQWTRWAVDLPTKSAYARDAAGRGPFSYCTAGAFLLGQVIARATHIPVDQYIKRRLFAPLGIRSWRWARSPDGEVMTGGGLELRSRDLAKLAWMLIDAGRWRGRQILPAAWLSEAMTPQRKVNAEQDYGYLFWHRTYATPCGRTSGWYMAGNGGNAVVMLADLRAAVVVTRQNYNTHGMHQQTVDLLEHEVLPAIPCTAHPESSR